MARRPQRGTRLLSLRHSHDRGPTRHRGCDVAMRVL